MLFFALSLIVFVNPRTVGHDSLSYWYVVLMLLNGGVVAYQAAVPQSEQGFTLTQVSSQMSLICRIPAVCLCQNIALVIACNIATVILVAVFSPLSFLGMESVSAITAVVAAVVLQQMIRRSAERSVNHSMAASEFEAAKALLQLICDAVIELDENLRLSKHSPDLAAILLRDGPWFHTNSLLCRDRCRLYEPWSKFLISRALHRAQI